MARLAADSLGVTAGSVEAHFSLDASVGALLRVRAGLSVRLDSVEGAAGGVDAAADLRVRLGTVARVLLEALEAVQVNPDLVRGAGLPEEAPPVPDDGRQRRP